MARLDECNASSLVNRIAVARRPDLRAKTAMAGHLKAHMNRAWRSPGKVDAHPMTCVAQAISEV